MGQEQVLELLKEHPKLRAEAIVEALQLSRSAVFENLKRLKKNNEVGVVEKGNQRFYHVLK